MASGIYKQELESAFGESGLTTGPQLSELDGLVADLRSHLTGRTLFGLSRQGVRTLAAESGVNRSRVQALADASKLEEETGLPAAVFYGLSRQDIPLDRETLFAMESEELRTNLRDAAATGIISLPDLAALDRIVERFGQLRARYLPLRQFGEMIGLDLPPESSIRLAERGIQSLQDVRKRGGLRAIKGITGLLNGDQIRALEAHSILSVLPLDPRGNQKLIKFGVVNMSAVCHSTDARLAEILEMERAEARRLQAIAATYRAALSVSVTDAVLSADTDNNASRLFRVDGFPRVFTTMVRSTVPANSCHSCDPCRSALSPAAYLVDLIDLFIDTFRTSHGTSPTVDPLTFPDLASLEARFRRPFGSLRINCQAVVEPVRQIAIAIEVLERFITTPPVTGYSRASIYSWFDYTDLRGKPLYPRPNVLPQMFDAYLTEVGVAPADFQAALAGAYPAGGGAADPAPLEQIAHDLGLTLAEITMKFGIANANWQPTIAVIDQMPDLMRKGFTNGLDRTDPGQFAAYRDALAQANVAVNRVQGRYLPDLRSNLIEVAIRQLGRNDIPPELAALTTERKLGNYLHIDLAAEACLMTTRVADAIEALQSFIHAFLSGREQPGYYLSFQDTAEGYFERRWEWVRRYEIWHAAQMVFLYPENFMLPRARPDSSKIFKTLLDELDQAAGDYSAIESAVQTYRSNAILVTSQSSNYASHPLSSNGLGTQDFRALQQSAYNSIPTGDPFRLYLDEWYLYLPLAVALALNAVRSCERAAQWLNTVLFPIAPNYPPNAPFAPIRLVWWGFEAGRTQGYDYRGDPAWLNDPFTPFAIARLRRGALERHVIAQHVENLLDWADAEFSRDTGEAISAARDLYERALELLEYDEVPQEEACLRSWRQLQAELSVILTAEELRLVRQLLDPIVADSRTIPEDIETLRSLFRKDEPFEDRLEEAIKRVDLIEKRALNERSIADIINDRRGYATLDPIELAFNSRYFDGYFLSLPTDTSPALALPGALIDRLVGGFCAPPNPIFTLHRFRAEANLEKILTCRNYAGMRRAVRVYAEGGDPVQAVQRRAAGEGIGDSMIPDAPPPIYRFSYLIERARYTVGIAQQFEALLLNAFQQEDQASYSLMLARQNLQVSQSHVTLQSLRLKEANDQVTLAQSQRERANFQRQHFRDLISFGLSGYERQALGAAWAAHDWAIWGTVVGGIGEIGGAIAGGIIGAIYGNAPGAAAGAVAGAIGAGIAGGGHLFQGISQVNSLYSQARSMQATFERREQEWQFQRDLAGWDYTIGEQGVTLANDQVSIRSYEGAVAGIQAGHTNDVVNYLGAKFLNTAMWQWMGRVVRGYYREHLNFATVIARMAQTALEFERQESITVINSFYGEREQRDLLTAERLLTDINKLDQHRLITEQRKKEISKTFSLAAFDPIEMQRLRDQGWMTFTTKLEDFDRDFPGHYLRLIKSVTISVIALIPPVEGIRATFSNTGISRVMVGPPFDQPRVIQRQPESIALSIPNQGTGLFETRLDDPVLLPFEASGVETTWTLEMPKGANRFDFGAIADILVTLRYTALEDTTYRRKVLQQMGVDANGRLRLANTISYSIRQTFADEWYDLFNPEFSQDPAKYGFDAGKIKPPYQMQVRLSQLDFAPNEDRQRIARVSLAFRQERFIKLPLEIEFRPEGSNTAYAFDGDYTWDVGVQNTGPFSFTAFTHRRNSEDDPWQPAATSLGTLAPFGNWYIKIKNGGTRLDGQAIVPADYQGLFSKKPAVFGQSVLELEWLLDGLLAIAYESDVMYKFASSS